MLLKVHKAKSTCTPYRHEELHFTLLLSLTVQEVEISREHEDGEKQSYWLVH